MNRQGFNSMARYNRSMGRYSTKPIAIVKIGGAVGQNILSMLLADMAELPYHWILVHGGGKQVSKISRHYGIEPRFIDGIRQTSPPEMDIIDMGLAGLMNTAILRRALSLGIRAVGLSGVDAGLFISEKISDDNHTGRISTVNPEILHYLLAADYLPVISSVSGNSAGEGININADDAALALAAAILPEKLIFISDIAGVLGPEDSQGKRERIPLLDGKKAREMIQTGIISNGMIPKVENALRSVREGSAAVLIGSIDESGDLNRIIQQQRGTKIIK